MLDHVWRNGSIQSKVGSLRLCKAVDQQIEINSG